MSAWDTKGSQSQLFATAKLLRGLCAMSFYAFVQHTQTCFRFTFEEMRNEDKEFEFKMYYSTFPWWTQLSSEIMNKSWFPPTDQRLALVIINWP